MSNIHTINDHQTRNEKDNKHEQFTISGNQIVHRPIKRSENLQKNIKLKKNDNEEKNKKKKINNEEKNEKEKIDDEENIKEEWEYIKSNLNEEEEKETVSSPFTLPLTFSFASSKGYSLQTNLDKNEIQENKNNKKNTKIPHSINSSATLFSHATPCRFDIIETTYLKSSSLSSSSSNSFYSSKNSSSCPVTCLQIVLEDRRKFKQKFYYHSTVLDLYQHIMSLSGLTGFDLFSGYPPKRLMIPNQTLKEAGLIGSRVEQRLTKENESI